MPRPIQFVDVLTRDRIVEELEAIEGEIRDNSGGLSLTRAAAARLAELKRAIAHKPIDLGD